MSKNRKRHNAPVGAPVSAPRTETNVNPSPTSNGQSLGVVFSRGVLLQLLAIVGLSCVLGFTFNAASPVGVRFAEPTASPFVTKANVKEVTPSTPTPPPPPKTNPIVLSPLPPAPVKVAAIPPPTLPTARPAAAPTPWSVSAAPPPTNPVVVAAPPPPAYPTPIHWPEAKVLAAEGRAVLVDVRPKFSYDAGHIPGATSLPEMSSPEEFRTFLSQQPTNMTVIVYCSSTSCSQSARVANRLVNEFHWPAVRYMTGGYAEYQQAELAKPSPQSAP